MIRLRNPDVFFASWASSAPVQTVIDRSAYYKLIWQNMPANCREDVNAAIGYSDEILSSGSAEEVSLIKEATWGSAHERMRIGLWL
jgi:hypothetical protein